MDRRAILPLITKDPITGAPLIVTRLESPDTGLVIEGAFTLGWLGRLTPEQLEFAGLLVRYRGNVQKLAAEIGIAYNTARNRLDDIVVALGESTENEREPVDRAAILARLAAGEIDFDEAMDELKG